MRDEFRGNFTRDTFTNDISDDNKQFSRVLFKQGKVLLDSDFNELQDILTNYMRTLTRDLIGSHGGPANGFRIVNLYGKYDEKGLPVAEEDQKCPIAMELGICPGHYYVDGILCENPGKPDEKGVPLPLSYKNQEAYPFPGSLVLDPQSIPKGKYLVYLDVWERTISYLQDDSIREKGLGGVDTAVRSKIVWQAKTLILKDEEGKDNDDIISAIISEIIEFLTGEKDHDDVRPKWPELTKCRNRNRGLLKAQAKPKDLTKYDDSKNPCIVPPDAGSMIVENCLYRIEIHNPGKIADHATFKWSRTNCSNDFGILPISTDKASDKATVTLKDLKGNEPINLSKGDWVEILDDKYILRSQAFPLWQVDTISGDSSTVDLSPWKAKNPSQDDEMLTSPDKYVFDKNPILRRWDHKEGRNLDDGGISIFEGAASIKEGMWLDIGNGIQVQFQQGGEYRTGDYWLIPARVETGNIEWPQQEKWSRPHGIEHHCAPLAVISIDGDGNISVNHDCRRTFERLAVRHGREHKEE